MSSVWQLPPQILGVLEQARAHQQKVVLATGVFDLLHEEHVLFLQKARAVGDVLVVGIESDVRVRRLKGPGRPIQTQVERQAAIEKLQLAQAVLVLPEAFDQPADFRHFLALIRPQILAVSSHSPHLDKKGALMAEIGGEVVVVHEHNPAVSTTLKLQQARVQTDE